MNVEWAARTLNFMLESGAANVIFLLSACSCARWSCDSLENFFGESLPAWSERLSAMAKHFKRLMKAQDNNFPTSIIVTLTQYDR
jgi:hypothetical protein